MNALAGKRVAVSLGASFMGYATHAGFLARLTALGVRPVALGGSSAGAIAAGLHGAGLSVETIRDVVTGAAMPLSFIKRTKWGWQILGDLFSRRQLAMFDASGAVPFFEQLVGARQIEELRDPKVLIAMTDLKEQRAVFAQDGPLARAMAASCTVPLTFDQLEWKGRLVCDGGVVHEAPIDPWFGDDSIDTIVVHRVMQEFRPRPWFIPSRIIHTLSEAHHCTNNQWLADRMALAKFHGKELLVANSTTCRPSIWSRRSRESCYAAGEASAQTFIESLSS